MPILLPRSSKTTTLSAKFSLSFTKQGLDQSLRSVDQYTKWFDSTVNVLYMFTDVRKANVTGDSKNM